MKRIALITLALCLASCAVQKPVTPTVNIKDSTVFHVKDSIAIKYVEVAVEVPVEVMREIVPVQDSSHLETSVAMSDAFIDKNGFLHHSLKNKKTALSTVTPVEEHHHEETSSNEHSETQITPQLVEIPAELTWWQKFRIGAFWWLAALCIVGWRRELAALGKKIIKLFV